MNTDRKMLNIRVFEAKCSKMTALVISLILVQKVLTKCDVFCYNN